jgi:ubiquinone/menaquinone biosynthesis C-methylase UbiE
MSVERAFYEQEDLWGVENDLDQERTLIRATEMARLMPPAVESVLDVGTGDGRLLHPLVSMLESDPFVVGLDRSSTALSHFSELGTQGSADALPFADRAFDVVIACEILEHLPEPIYLSARTELARVARRSVIITVPNREKLSRAAVRCEMCGCQYNRRRHLRRFERETFDGFLPGFGVAETAEFGHHTRIYPARIRQELERRGLLSVHDAPECPQCGQAHGRRETDPKLSTSPTQHSRSKTDSYFRVRSLVPAERQPYWLGVRLDRS